MEADLEIMYTGLFFSNKCKVISTLLLPLFEKKIIIDIYVFHSQTAHLKLFRSHFDILSYVFKALKVAHF